MYSGESTRALPRVGFPIRRSRGQRLVSTSPGLIAAAHVLHRLSAPRHPPCALVLLIEKNTCCDVAMEFSRCGWTRAQLGPSKLNSVNPCRSRVVEVDVHLGEPCFLTSFDIGRRASQRARARVTTDSKGTAPGT